MAEQWQNEEKKSKGWEEKWRPDRWDGIGWALIFIWGALVLLAQSTNYSTNFSWWDGFSVFITGIGIIVLLGLFIPTHRHRMVGSLIFGFILIGIGLGGLVEWNLVWPLVLFTIGIIILLKAIVTRH